MADALRQSGDLENALTAVRESRRLQEQLPDGGETWRRANLILAIWREGSILAEDGDISLDRPQEAIPVFRHAVDLASELADKDRDDTTHHQLGGEVARRLGDLLRRSDPQAALAVFDQGILRTREARSPNSSVKRTEAVLLARSSYVLRLVHRDDESRQRIDAAFRLLKDIGDYPATVIEPASEADLALRALADHYAATSQPGKAVETYQELLVKLKGSEPDVQNDLRNATYVSSACEALARILKQQGRLQEAASYNAERAGIWRNWDQKLPGNLFVRRQLASVAAN